MMTKGKQAGRMTRQRRIVLDILAESQEHLDAETIYLLARARDARISLATVYRALALFKRRGLVQEQRLGEGHGHFETTKGEPHDHFTCTACGRVIELEAAQLHELAGQLCAGRGLQMSGVQVLVTGLCAECVKQGPGMAGLA
jgi:Fur family transcriptional regulator, ferric uptake regulator